MNDNVSLMTAELRDELASSNLKLLADPRTQIIRMHHLKAIGQSAAHCFQSFQTDHFDSMAIRLGRGAHAIMFGKPVAVFDVPAKKGKGKAPRNGEAWETFKSANPFATILSSKEHDKAQAIASAIRRHPDASRLLFSPGVLHESTILWRQGAWKRQSTPDARGPLGVVELKTTRCAQPERFARDAMFRGYHAQLADQSAAIEYSTGSRPVAAYIVAVETVEPYVVYVAKLTERAIEKGAQLCRLWLERFTVCAEANYWPGYMEGIGELDAPDDDIELRFGDDSDDGEDGDQ